jgi:hypothetical protein
MMKKLAFLAAFVLAAPAGAATYVTPPVDVANGDTVVCVVQNVTDQTRTITTRMWAGNPRVLLDEDIDVAIAGRVTTWVMNTNTPQTGAYCEIEGLSKKLRGWIGVSSPTGSTQYLLPAAK